MEQLKFKIFFKKMHAYLPLIGILIAGSLGFYIFSYDKIFQAALSISMAAGYVAWGVLHHKVRKDLYFEVFVEYVVIALLGLVILFSVIFRS